MRNRFTSSSSIASCGYDGDHSML